jgi:acetyltransferase
MTDVPATRHPADLVQFVTLRDGRRLRIRALRSCEDRPIRDLFAHLSARSRYQRFLSPMPTLPAALARQLACGDSRRHLALIAEYNFDTAERETVALGNYGAIDRETVEVALVVRDDWQRHQVGIELARRMLQAAERRGFHQFVANILLDNVAIRGLLDRLGRVVSQKISDGVAELAFVSLAGDGHSVPIAPPRR